MQLVQILTEVAAVFETRGKHAREIRERLKTEACFNRKVEMKGNRKTMGIVKGWNIKETTVIKDV